MEGDLFGAEEGFVHNQSGTVPIERLLLIILDLKEDDLILVSRLCYFVVACHVIHISINLFGRLLVRVCM